MVSSRHDHRPGQLQRGTGRGFLAALQAPRAARDEVLQCILADPRLDPQLESRARYYAELAAELHLPLQPLVRHAEDQDGDALATGVLAELAARGSGAARALLADPHRHAATSLGMVEYLLDFPEQASRLVPLGAVALLAEHLHDSGDLEYDAAIHAEFWTPFRDRLPLVRAALLAAGGRDDPQPASAVLAADPQATSTAGLLDLLHEHASSRLCDELAQRRSQGDRALLAFRVEHDVSRPRMHAAAKALGVMGDPRLLELCEEQFGRDDDLTDRRRMLSATERQRRTALLSYLLALPPAVTLPLARSWWPRGRFLRAAAARVLEQHAEPADATWLAPWVERAVERDAAAPVAVAVGALVRLRARSALPAFLAVAERTACSWTRSRALRGIAFAPDDVRAQTALTEALWDCEQDARELACQHSLLATPASRDRAAELAADLYEESSVRDAARARCA